MKKLTSKQQVFRNAYLRNKGNATEAAREAKYSYPNKQGPRMTKIPAIKAAIEATEGLAMERAIVDASWVLTGIKEIAERCMQRVPVMIQAGSLRVQMTDENGQGVWAFDANGANRALELLGKHLKLFTDRIEIESAQIGQLLGLVTSILKRVLPETLWPKVAEEFARASEIYGSNDAGLS
jgi:phage terminase small subunit